MKNVICLEKPDSLLERLRALAARDEADGFSLTTCAANLDSILWLSKALRPVMLVIEEAEAEKLAIEKLRKSAPPEDLHILIMSKSQDIAVLQRYIRLGCSGTVLQSDSEEIFLKAIRAIFGGEIWVPRKVLSGLVQSVLFGEPDRRLTRRETEILKLICLGETNQQIADRLFISRETVRWHVRALYPKIGAKDRDSAIRYATDLGLNKGTRRSTALG